MDQSLLKIVKILGEDYHSGDNRKPTWISAVWMMLRVLPEYCHPIFSNYLFKQLQVDT